MGHHQKHEAPRDSLAMFHSHILPKQIGSEINIRRCAWCVYLWGDNPQYIVDALVLGESLTKAGTRARMVCCCVNEDTIDVGWHKHLECHWEIMTVKHLGVPSYIKNTAMPHLKEQQDSSMVVV